jgi:hypothetical protein
MMVEDYINGRLFLRKRTVWRRREDISKNNITKTEVKKEIQQNEPT